MTTEPSKGYVYRTTTSLTAEAVAALLKTHFDGADAIVRRTDWIEMVSFSAANEESVVEEWPEGQIFNSAAELRWRQARNGFAALWLAEQPTSLDGFRPLEGSPFTAISPSESSSHGFLLWGTRRDEGRACWWEARIPRPLRYPGSLSSEKRLPRLSYRLYQEGGSVRWIRLSSLVEVDDE